MGLGPSLLSWRCWWPTWEGSPTLSLTFTWRRPRTAPRLPEPPPSPSTLTPSTRQRAGHRTATATTTARIIYTGTALFTRLSPCCRPSAIRPTTPNNIRPTTLAIPWSSTAKWWLQGAGGRGLACSRRRTGSRRGWREVKSVSVDKMGTFSRNIAAVRPPSSFTDISLLTWCSK